MDQRHGRLRAATIRGMLGVLMLVMAGACGATISELRATPPQVRTVDKDAACVFSRLQRRALDEQTCGICAQLVWTGNWDPYEGEGVVQAQITYYEYWPIMFTVRAKGAATVIEKRVPDHYLSRYGEIANRIYLNTDFSRCPSAGAGAAGAPAASGAAVPR